MIYHKYSLVGLMLWIRYGLLKLKPFKSLQSIYAEYLESPLTKAYTVREVKELTNLFSDKKFEVQLSHGDLLIGDVGVRHKGIMLSILKVIYPKTLVKILSNFFPVGLYLLIELKK